MSTDPKITNRRLSSRFRLLWLELKGIPVTIFGPLLPAILNERVEEWRGRHFSTLSNTQLSDDTKKRARLLIERLEGKLRHEILLDSVLFRVTFAIFAAALLLMPRVIEQIYDLPAGHLTVERIIFPYLGAATACLIVLGLPATLAEEDQGEPAWFGPASEEVRYSPRFAGLWMISVLFIYVVLIARILQIAPPSQSYEGLPPYFAVLCGLSTAITFTILSESCRLAAMAWWKIKMDRWRNDLTDAMVLSPLLLTLRATQGDWLQMQQRISALGMLEEAAANFEKGFARAIGRTDDTTNAWLLREINHRAAGIREIKRDVCFPKRDTHTQIKDKLEALICAIADGVWAELPTFEPPDISPGRRRRLIGILRQFFIAFLPLGILGFTKVADISLDSTISAYLWTSAIGWAVLGILVILDPRLRDRVAAFRDTAESWRSFHI
jgi:hypothetical protein